MAEWLRQVSQGHEMYYHDFEAMGLSPGWVDLGVYSSSKLSLNQNYYNEVPLCNQVSLFQIQSALLRNLAPL